MKRIVPLIGRATGFTLLALALNAALLLPLPTVILADHPHPTVPAQAPADALSAVIADSDNLLRVWHFDPALQDDAPDFGWFLYYPRPVFAAANTLDKIESSKFYWIAVDHNQTVTLGGRTRSLFKRWNPVIW